MNRVHLSSPCPWQYSAFILLLLIGASNTNRTDAQSIPPSATERISHICAQYQESPYTIPEGRTYLVQALTTLSAQQQIPIDVLDHLAATDMMFLNSIASIAQQHGGVIPQKGHRTGWPAVNAKGQAIYDHAIRIIGKQPLA